MINRFFKKLKIYILLPEMATFWFFLLVALIIIVLNFIDLPNLTYVTPILLLLVGIPFLVVSLRLSSSNLEIKLERNQMKNIIFNLQDGIIAYDTDFKILVFNRAAEGIFGIPAEVVVGKMFSLDYASRMKSKTLMQSMFPSLAASSVNRSEIGSNIQIVDISFEDVGLELRITTTRVLDSANKLLGFVKIINDRTRQVELLKSKSAFITVAAHQLRTPVNALSWTMETLKKDEGLSEESAMFVTNGLKAANKLSKIVNDLLDVAKIEEGRFGYKFAEVDLVQFLSDLLEADNSAAEEYGVNLYFEKPEESAITIMIDKERLALALNNVIDNAIKYNVKNGTVTVKISRLPDSPFIEVSIADTGIGVSSENLEKLFTKFFRGENVVKIQTEGSGLGLYIAKNIIKRHGGDVRVESELNRGTTFHFFLPTDPSLIPKKEFILD
ncbi:MAG: ATP-binding protein [bacterium]|nr:ATP-binding protein [bacterium]